MFQSPTGGRVTVFQACLPNSGPGSLTTREDPSQRAGKEAPHLNPATDFYKRLALDCSGQQIAVDLFLVNGQYSDLATLSEFHFRLFHLYTIFSLKNIIFYQIIINYFYSILTLIFITLKCLYTRCVILNKQL